MLLMVKSRRSRSVSTGRYGSASMTKSLCPREDALDGRVAAGKGDIVGAPVEGELDYPEAAADQIDPAVLFESGRDLLERVAGDEDIDLGRFGVPYRIADIAPDGIDVPPEKSGEQVAVGEEVAQYGLTFRSRIWPGCPARRSYGP
jgi:hypothetical protein